MVPFRVRVQFRFWFCFTGNRCWIGFICVFLFHCFIACYLFCVCIFPTIAFRPTRAIAKFLFTMVLGFWPHQNGNKKCSFIQSQSVQTYYKSHLLFELSLFLSLFLSLAHNIKYILYSNVLSVGHKFEIIQVYAQIIVTTDDKSTVLYLFIYFWALTNTHSTRKRNRFLLFYPTMYFIVCQYSTSSIHSWSLIQ